MLCLRNFSCLAFGLFVAAWPSVSNTQTTGNALKEWCEDPEEVFQALCAVYIEGVRGGLEYGAISTYLDFISRIVFELSEQTYSEVKALRTSDLLGICQPAGVTGDQIIDVVKKFLEENPERRHEDASALVYSALFDAFPCPE